jgi:hypothetical protein
LYLNTLEGYGLLTAPVQDSAALAIVGLPTDPAEELELCPISSPSQTGVKRLSGFTPSPIS